jgi:hypothetical protein
MALAYASDELKGNEEIIKAAVRQNCEALQFVPNDQRAWGAEVVQREDPEYLASLVSRPDMQGCLQYPPGSDGESSSED